MEEKHKSTLRKTEKKSFPKKLWATLENNQKTLMVILTIATVVIGVTSVGFTYLSNERAQEEFEIKMKPYISLDISMTGEKDFLLKIKNNGLTPALIISRTNRFLLFNSTKVDSSLQNEEGPLISSKSKDITILKKDASQQKLDYTLNPDEETSIKLTSIENLEKGEYVVFCSKIKYKSLTENWETGESKITESFKINGTGSEFIPGTTCLID